jgi:hypothetical protein
VSAVRSQLHCSRWLACSGRWSGDRADQASPGIDIGRVEQAIDRHLHESRIGDEAVAVGVHDAVRFCEQEPGLRIAWPARGDIRPLEQHHQLEEPNPAGRRRGDTGDVDPNGAA